MTLTESIQDLSTVLALPWGGQGPTLSPDAVDLLADRHDLPGWRIEAAAINDGVLPTRYLRNMHSISPEGQVRLLESRIAMVGLGGLGGALLEQFLRMGIGRIRAADGDCFEASNLNRQFLASDATIGHPKTHAAGARAAVINPSVECDFRATFLDTESLPEFLDGSMLAVDALGGLKDRLALQRAAGAAEIPLVTGALAGWTGYVAVVPPGHFGPADLMGHDNAAEEQLGCPAPAVTHTAALMAAAVSRIITGDTITDGTMTIFDLAEFTFDTIVL